MKLDDLQSITRVKGQDALELAKQGAKGALNLYTVVKKDVIIYFDYVESQVCTDTGRDQLTAWEKQTNISYQRGDILQLPITAAEELWLNKELKGKDLELVFQTPTSNHRFHSYNDLDEIKLDDVYIDQSAISNNATSKSPRSKAHHTLAIEAAISILGNDASNADIHEWIKKETEDPSDEHKSYMNYLDFEDDDIEPFNTTSQQAIVMKSKDKPISKQAFQDACARARRKI